MYIIRNQLWEIIQILTYPGVLKLLTKNFLMSGELKETVYKSGDTLCHENMYDFQ